MAPLDVLRAHFLVNAHSPSAVLAFSNRFSVFVCTSGNDSKTLLVDTNFFENGEKNCFSNENGCVWMGPEIEHTIFKYRTTNECTTSL